MPNYVCLGTIEYHQKVSWLCWKKISALLMINRISIYKLHETKMKKKMTILASTPCEDW